MWKLYLKIPAYSTGTRKSPFHRGRGSHILLAITEDHIPQIPVSKKAHSQHYPHTRWLYILQPAVRGSDYSPAIAISDDKLVTENFRDRKKKEIMGWISMSSLIPLYTIHPLFVHVCTKFQHSTCRPVWQTFWALWTGVKEKWIKGRIRAAAWFWYTRYIYPLSMCVPSLNFIGHTIPAKIETKFFNIWKLERKKTEDIKDK